MIILQQKQYAITKIIKLTHLSISNILLMDKNAVMICSGFKSVKIANESFNRCCCPKAKLPDSKIL